MQRIFVGDIQGCADELGELLERARQRFGDAFEIWAVGDLVNRGPGSLRVLRALRELADRGRARAVLGNHELHLLRAGLGVAELAPGDTAREVLEAPDRADWIEWLRRLPLVETGCLGATPFAMVHAAAHPGWSLDKLAERAARASARLGAPERGEAVEFLAADRGEEADLDLLLRLTACRSAGPGGAWSAEEPARPRDAWHRRWTRRGHRYGVVFGHWARQGLLVAPGLRGLDTGCVHHGRWQDGFLTAWLPDPARPDPFAVPDAGFWQIRARRRYHPWGAGAPGAATRAGSASRAPRPRSQ